MPHAARRCRRRKRHPASRAVRFPAAHRRRHGPRPTARGPRSDQRGPGGAGGAHGPLRSTSSRRRTRIRGTTRRPSTTSRPSCTTWHRTRTNSTTSRASTSPPALVADALREALLTWLERVGEKLTVTACRTRPGQRAIEPLSSELPCGTTSPSPINARLCIPTALDGPAWAAVARACNQAPLPRGVCRVLRSPKGRQASPAPLARARNEQSRGAAGSLVKAGQQGLGRPPVFRYYRRWAVLGCTASKTIGRPEHEVPVSRPETMSWRPVNPEHPWQNVAFARVVTSRRTAVNQRERPVRTGAHHGRCSSDRVPPFRASGGWTRILLDRARKIEKSQTAAQADGSRRASRPEVVTAVVRRTRSVRSSRMLASSARGVRGEHGVRTGAHCHAVMAISRADSTRVRRQPPAPSSGTWRQL